MKHWIVNTDTPETKLDGMKISREIYRMSRPFPDPKDVTKYAVSWFFSDDGNQCALEFPEKGDKAWSEQKQKYIIIQSDMPIDDRRDTTEIEKLLYEKETSTKKEQFRLTASKANRPELVDLLPDKTKLKSESWLYQNGWTEKV